jgi:hypothetical protein
MREISDDEPAERAWLFRDSRRSKRPSDATACWLTFPQLHKRHHDGNCSLIWTLSSDTNSSGIITAATTDGGGGSDGGIVVTTP